ncbi:unnamed protein product [Cunninghamella echinulata]
MERVEEKSIHKDKNDVIIKESNPIEPPDGGRGWLVVFGAFCVRFIFHIWRELFMGGLFKNIQ